MAEGSAAGGAPETPVMPETFGEKLAYVWPHLLITMVLAVVISFVILWIWAGKLTEKIEAVEKAHNDLVQKFETKTKEIDGRLTQLNTDIKAVDAKYEGECKKISERVTTQEQTIATMQQEKATLTTQLQGAINDLKAVTTALNEFRTEQKTVDGSQNKSIAENTQAIEYIKRELKRLDVLEADVRKLFGQDEILQGEYVALRKELTLVRDRGAVTEVELNDISHRIRVFQLRVLAARAKQAADAAREGDIKRLIDRLTDN